MPIGSRSVTAYPCPCCGYLVLPEPPGSYDICPICFWEDDISQLRFVDLGGGANRPSLIEAQKNYETFGCSERRFHANVRPPTADERRDSEWRVARSSDIEPRVRGKDYGSSCPADPATLYYWRASFWRTSSG
jgi:hypothetical protein